MLLQWGDFWPSSAISLQRLLFPELHPSLCLFSSFFWFFLFVFFLYFWYLFIFLLYAFVVDGLIVKPKIVSSVLNYKYSALFIIWSTISKPISETSAQVLEPSEKTKHLYDYLLFSDFATDQGYSCSKELPMFKSKIGAMHLYSQNNQYWRKVIAFSVWQTTNASSVRPNKKKHVPLG